MKLVFDSMDELRKFVDDYDGDEDGGTDTTTTTGQPATTTRRRRGPNKPKGGDINTGVAGNAGATAGFSPPAVGQAAPSATGGFPSGPGASTGFPGNPPVHPLVTQIVAKVDATLAAGSPVDPMVAWFRTALPGAEQANWEQIKTAFLPRAPEPTLVSIASQMGLIAPTQ